MNNRRFDDLIAYLDALTKLSGVDFNCSKEINECVTAIRTELGLAHEQAGEGNPECSECGGTGFVSMGEGTRGVKQCVSCGGSGESKR